MKKMLLYTLLVLAVQNSDAQTRYNYAAQKNFIPAALGKVYLGMPLKALAAQLDLSKAAANADYEPLQLTVPFSKGNITEVRIMIHGLSAEEKEALLRRDTVIRKESYGDVEDLFTGINTRKIGSKGIVYALYISFDADFNLDAFTQKAFGKPTDVHKEGDYYFYDKQWTKKTSDGLGWLIRCFNKENKSLQLLGIIKGTEWDPNA